MSVDARRVEAASQVLWDSGEVARGSRDPLAQRAIAAADEAVGGVVAYEKYNDAINERINFQIELADTRKAADKLTEALKLAHGCLREVRRDFNAPINNVIDEVHDTLAAHRRGAA